MNGDKKIIYFLVGLIIILSIILLVKIKTQPKYNPKIFNEIYYEYENIFEENGNKQNMQGSKSITDNTNKQTMVAEITQSNKGQGNVIGKIIIPKINIECPIIKETTTEYLKIAPTKYCGPEVNEIRKFSYSRS